MVIELFQLQIIYIPLPFMNTISVISHNHHKPNSEMSGIGCCMLLFLEIKELLQVAASTSFDASESERSIIRRFPEIGVPSNHPF